MDADPKETGKAGRAGKQPARKRLVNAGGGKALTSDVFVKKERGGETDDESNNAEQRDLQIKLYCGAKSEPHACARARAHRALRAWMSRPSRRSSGRAGGMS